MDKDYLIEGFLITIQKTPTGWSAKPGKSEKPLYSTDAGYHLVKTINVFETMKQYIEGIPPLETEELLITKLNEKLLWNELSKLGLFQKFVETSECL